MRTDFSRHYSKLWKTIIVLSKFITRQKYRYVHLLNIVFYIIFIRKIYFSFTYQPQFPSRSLNISSSHPELLPRGDKAFLGESTKSGKWTWGRTTFPHSISRFRKVSHHKEQALKIQFTHLGYVLVQVT